MKLIEKHIVKKNNIFYKEIDAICFKSKNLYNKALYVIRQEYIKSGNLIEYRQIDKIAQKWEEYKALGAMQSQQTLKILEQNWKSYEALKQDYKKNPKKYTGKPRIPKYLDKNGRFVAVFTKQRVSKPRLRSGKICPSKTNVIINTQIPAEDFQCVRLVPRNDFYSVEVVYNKKENTSEGDKYIGIDLGINNLATIAGEVKPTIINGKPLKSVNQYYNKKKAKMQSKLPKNNKNSKQITKLTNKRNKKVDDYLHKASRKIIDICLANQVGNIVIGKNKGWKQNINIGKKNNQTFTSIPFSRFIHMIEYKAQLFGIKVITREESYTSKCSFLDNEPIKKHKEYKGKRVKRGLFKASCGKTINADVNGALNILRKEVPRLNLLSEGIEGFVVNPIVLTC